ncbi:MAG: NAD(P)-binding domain-containing protein [Bradyrhizobium sp.]|uniref:3-hydroxyacyl-CoA dehydrogenase family protein n=1 Tax=Bradyrhizobium sp. TaxID=376 RepID=UPI001DD557D7|nr:3-hydroxyacyl-CoA dehydrogenase NAD-binding domain-containing protein [Bradyrhizobium sp.]MBV9564572.1 NAD(P)-binding domain-containing protein [Bradyrhizobium sp.]
MTERIAIIGGGLMGHGIALVFACAGHQVRITDAVSEARAHIRKRIETTLGELGRDRKAVEKVQVVDTLKACVADADVVIEAAPENLELKQQIFAEVEQAAPSGAILASNTSVITIGQIMSPVKDKSRALGTHWWNPPYLVPLVEVVRTSDVSEATVAGMVELLRRVGKSPVEVRKDVPGFVGNRLQHALWREAIALVAEGVCDAKTVDEVVKSSFGARLAVLGPIENADLVGVDLTRAIHSYILPSLDRATEPSPYLDRLIGEERLGFKSGRGFRDWPAEAQAALRAQVTRHLKTMFDTPRGD